MRHFRVTVSVDGEEILAIETEMLAGVENIEDYAEEIRHAAHHPLAFIGPEDQEPFIIEDKE